MEQIFNILGVFVLITLSLGIARQLSEQNVVMGNLLENFSSQNEGQAPAGGPADDTLLSDVLPSKNGEKGTLTAKSCYDADFMSHTQKGGDFTQRTNNFKHGNPDNCSAPFTELVNSIYE